MADNIANKLLSIKDFSELTGIKQSTLRYYDDLGLFHPALRGENGYRYYSPTQLVTINAITVLANLDISIKDITDVLKDRTPENVLKFIYDKEVETTEQLKKLQNMLDIFRTFRNLIHRGLSVDADSISVDFYGDLPITIGPENDFSRAEGSFYEPFLHFCTIARETHINLDFPIAGLFEDLDAFLRAPNEPTRFFSVDPNGLDRRPAGTYAVCYSRGYYGQVKDKPKQLADFCREQNLKTIGPVYNIFLIDEISEADHDKYLLEISVQVSRD